MTGLHVSISAEPIFNLGSFEVTNSMFTGVIVTLLLIVFSYWLSKNIKQQKAPKGVQNLIEMMFESLIDLMVGIAGEKKTKEFFPVVTTLFIYILFSNWTGLLPGVGTIGVTRNVESVVSSSEERIGDQEAEDDGVVSGEDSHESPAATTHEETKDDQSSSEAEAGSTEQHTTFVPLIRPPSADLNSTLALAIISVLGSQIIGFKYLKFGYFKKFFNFSGPMQFVMGLLDLTSEASRILSFAFRLFGNIFAGEVLLSVMLFLLPFLAPLPFVGLEVFVGLIQALVFAILTLVFWNMATIAHDEH